MGNTRGFSRPSGDSLMAFMQRNSLAGTTGRTGRDAWHHYIVSDVGIDGTMADIEKLWLRKHGGSGETPGDLWNSYLTAKGFTTGSVNDKFNNWLDHGAP